MVRENQSAAREIAERVMLTVCTDGPFDFRKRDAAIVAIDKVISDLCDEAAKSAHKPAPDWQTRVVEEYQEVGRKVENLLNFICSEHFRALDKCDQFLLREQRAAMEKYESVLAARIARFGKN